MPRTLAFILLAVLASPAHAEPPSLKGTFGFDSLRPEKSKCAAVKGALLAKLERQYTCSPHDAESASGVKVAAVCKARKGRSEWMVFSTLADCRTERETQLANGP